MQCLTTSNCDLRHNFFINFLCPPSGLLFSCWLTNTFKVGSRLAQSLISSQPFYCFSCLLLVGRTCSFFSLILIEQGKLSSLSIVSSFTGSIIVILLIILLGQKINRIATAKVVKLKKKEQRKYFNQNNCLPPSRQTSKHAFTHSILILLRI